MTDQPTTADRALLRDALRRVDNATQAFDAVAVLGNMELTRREAQRLTASIISAHNELAVAARELLARDEQVKVLESQVRCLRDELQRQTERADYWLSAHASASEEPTADDCLCSLASVACPSWIPDRSTGRHCAYCGHWEACHGRDVLSPHTIAAVEKASVSEERVQSKSPRSTAMKTLEQYLRDTVGRARVDAGMPDHVLRATVHDSYVSFYIHPHGVNGETLNFNVYGNEVRPWELDGVDPGLAASPREFPMVTDDRNSIETLTELREYQRQHQARERARALRDATAALHDAARAVEAEPDNFGVCQQLEAAWKAVKPLLPPWMPWESR